jgi:hypothetical protein
VSIHLAFTDLEALQARCQVSAIRLGLADHTYDGEALLPDDNLTPLGPDLAARLRAQDATPASTLVELVRMPSGDVWEGVHALEPLAHRMPAKFLGRVDCEPHQRTTTVDPRTARRLGVHLDNFDRLPLERRAESRRRMAANLGPGSRYLLVATVDIREIAKRSAEPIRHPHTDHIRRHVANGGELMCLRIRLDPGEGYIAPTELIPHDGSTWDLQRPSTAAFWLGEWQRGVLPHLA